MLSDRRVLVSCLLLLAILPIPVRGLAGEAQDPAPSPRVFRDQVTVTATGEETPVEEVPASVTVIDRREMDDAASDTVADLLRRVPGLIVLRSGAEGSLTSVFTRGTNSNQTLVLYDGVRLNSPYFSGYDWSQLTTSGLERIEVVRGPYSVLWGADAVGGVVNLIPARARDGFGGGALVEGGESGWKRDEASAGWAAGGFDVSASGFTREGDQGLENSDFSLDQIFVDGGYSWAPGSRVGLLVQHLDSDVEIPFAGAAATPRRRQGATQLLVAVPLRWRVAPGWNLEGTFSRVERDLTFRDPDDPWGFTASDTAADTDEVRLASSHALGDHALTWGAQWRRDTVDDRSSFGTNLDGRDTDTLGIFVQDGWRVSRKVRLLAGLRWDDADEWGSEFSPRVGASWRAAPGWEFRASWGRAFRQPSVGELYFPFSGNPELDAERSTSTEAGVVWRAPGDTARIELSLFSTRIEDLIQFDYATYAFANVASADILGAEASAGLRLAGDLGLRAQVTWLDTEDDQGRELLRRPAWSGSVTLSGALGWETLRGDLTLLWLGSRDDVDPVSFGRVRLGGTVTADLALAWRVARPLELTLRVVNLGDRSWEPVAGYPAPGRRFMGGLRVTF